MTTSTRRRSARAGRPLILVLPAVMALAFLVLPMIGLLARAPWRTLPERLTSAEVGQALRLSLVSADVSATMAPPESGAASSWRTSAAMAWEYLLAG